MQFVVVDKAVAPLKILSFKPLEYLVGVEISSCGSLKFAGVVYHLDHDEKDKSNFYKNDLMQKQTIKLNKIKASNGLSQLIDKIE